MRVYDELYIMYLFMIWKYYVWASRYEKGIMENSKTFAIFTPLVIFFTSKFKQTYLSKTTSLVIYN